MSCGMHAISMAAHLNKGLTGQPATDDSWCREHRANVAVAILRAAGETLREVHTPWMAPTGSVHPPGLTNYGMQTCYTNAAVQLLHNIPCCRRAVGASQTTTGLLHATRVLMSSLTRREG